MTSESDEAFIKRMAFYDYTSQYREDDVDRLFALARRGAEAAARIEQLEAEIKTAIRQFEDGNRLECHRTLCTVIYGKQY